MANNIQTQEYKQNIKAICNLLKEIEKLAPHPDRPSDRGPVSVHVGSNIMSISNNNDSILGDIMIEAMASQLFGGGATLFENNSSLLSNIECYDMYQSERSKNVRNLNTGGFNSKKSYKDLVTEYEMDLPQRIILERKLGILIRKIGDNEIIKDEELYQYKHKLKHDYSMIA